MEQTGNPGYVQITGKTAEMLNNRWELKEREPEEVEKIVKKHPNLNLNDFKSYWVVKEIKDEVRHSSAKNNNNNRSNNQKKSNKSSKLTGIGAGKDRMASSRQGQGNINPIMNPGYKTERHMKNQLCQEKDIFRENCKIQWSDSRFSMDFDYTFKSESQESKFQQTQNYIEQGYRFVLRKHCEK